MIVFYRLGFSFLFLVTIFFGPLFSKKIRAGFRLRRERLKAPFLPAFENSFVVHAASGEYEYARPLIQELKKNFPQTPVIVTFFSPTYVKVIDKDPLVDLAVPLPFDFPGPVRGFLKKVRPLAVFIARTDLWPEFLRQCRQKKIPLILFSYYENPKKPLLGRFLRHRLLRQISHVDCVGPVTAERLLRSGLPSVTAFGDTRFDRVQERKLHPKTLPFSLPKEQTLILGSTWKEDEDALLPALAATQELWRQVVIAPHEPSPDHLKDLQKRLKHLGLSFQLFSETTTMPSAKVLIVDQVGWLFDLYRMGEVAFVGGSFKGSVHSVMEPLAFGLRVLVGPFIKNNAEALEFQKMTFEGSSAVESVKNTAALKQALKNHFSKPLEERIKIQNRIEGEVLSRAGASRKLMEWFAKTHPHPRSTFPRK